MTVGKSQQQRDSFTALYSPTPTLERLASGRKFAFEKHFGSAYYGGAMITQPTAMAHRAALASRTNLRLPGHGADTNEFASQTYEWKRRPAANEVLGKSAVGLAAAAPSEPSLLTICSYMGYDLYAKRFRACPRAVWKHFASGAGPFLLNRAESEATVPPPAGRSQR